MKDRLIALLKTDTLRLEALACVSALQMPEAYIAAGFLRNLVWDVGHSKAVPTPLNDVDVVYFDPHCVQPEREMLYEAQLQKALPALRWQVRNQARMHLKNGHPPYTDVKDAMGYWPEKETAVAVRQILPGQFDVISAFSLDSLFALQITRNPRCSRELFLQRLHSKGWLQTWPLLNPVY